MKDATVVSSEQIVTVCGRWNESEFAQIPVEALRDIHLRNDAGVFICARLE